MIKSSELAQRIAQKRAATPPQPIPEDMFESIFGAGCAPEDFCRSFNDSYVDNGVGPTFVDDFTDRYPFGNSDFLLP